jgi:hypothetical protein
MTPGQTWGELSFRDAAVEVHVGGIPIEVLNPDSSTKTVVITNARDPSNFVPAPCGGYILPGATLDNPGLFGSQWYQPPDGPWHYDGQDIQANVKPGP